MVKSLSFESNGGLETHRRSVKVFGKDRKQKYNRNGNLSTEDQRRGNQKLKPEGQKRIATIWKALHESKPWCLRALSAKTAISHTTCYRVITKTLKMWQQRKIWVPGKLTHRPAENACNFQKFINERFAWNILLLSIRHDSTSTSQKGIKRKNGLA